MHNALVYSALFMYIASIYIHSELASSIFEGDSRLL
jgi:hypothetical protein